MATKKKEDDLKRAKHALSEVAKDCPVREFRPLVSWPAATHMRDADIQAFTAIPSQYAK